jgi:hypothetical protein
MKNLTKIAFALILTVLLAACQEKSESERALAAAVEISCEVVKPMSELQADLDKIAQKHGFADLEELMYSGAIEDEDEISWAAKKECDFDPQDFDGPF